MPLSHFTTPSAGDPGRRGFFFRGLPATFALIRNCVATSLRAALCGGDVFTVHRPTLISVTKGTSPDGSPESWAEVSVRVTFEVPITLLEDVQDAQKEHSIHGRP